MVGTILVRLDHPIASLKLPFRCETRFQAVLDLLAIYGQTHDKYDSLR